MIACTAGTIALVVASAAPAQGAGPPSVYRCKQPNGSIAYQDYPCKGGVTVDIKPDAADPRAIERLREREAEFQRSYAQRRAEEAAQRQRQPVVPPQAPLPPQADNDVVPYETPPYVFIAPASRAFHGKDRHVMHHPPKRPKPASPAPTHRPHRLEPA
jgi:hypothetical protein